MIDSHSSADNESSPIHIAIKKTSSILNERGSAKVLIANGASISPLRIRPTGH